MADRKIRILLMKIGIDVHDVGIKNLALMLRDKGMEVIYTGLRMPIETVPDVALEEDVDMIGVSFHQGAHMVLAPQLVKLLRDHGVADVPVIVGGIIPPEDIPKLKESGVAEVFLPGSGFDDIVAYIESTVQARAS